MRIVYFSLVLLNGTFPVNAADEWPDYRGPTANGCSDVTGLPLSWSETSNVAWKTFLPGRGWSSPVIWGDQVWMTSATADGRELYAIAVDKRSGKLVHHLRVFEVEDPHEIDPVNSYASPSPVIDSSHVYVHFGTYGTACLETETGTLVWARRDFSVDHQKGPGSSPVLHRDLLIFPCDGNDVQYVVALEKTTGKIVWKTERSVDLSRRAPDYRKSFSTPLVLRFAGREQVVSTAAGAVFAYDPLNGRELWQVGYAGHTNVARPVFEDDLVAINTGYAKPQLWGVRLGGSGNVTESHVVWKQIRNVPIKPSPLIEQGLLYMVSDSGGVVTCLEARTGQTVWKERLGGNYAASPILAEGCLYFSSEEGKTTVLQAGRRYRERAINYLDEGLMASPAVSGNALYFRTAHHLYRIEKRS